MNDGDFDWMAEAQPGERGGITAPDGGLEDPDVVPIVRGIVAALHERGCRATWLIVDGTEAVGMCSYKHPPRNGEVEIGYGIAATRRNRGYATRGVALVAEHAKAEGLRHLTAETVIDNVSSARVLQKNGFISTGRRIDLEDGEVCSWRKELGDSVK